MTVELLSERHLEFLSLKRGFIGSSESIHVKIQHCWKSHAADQVCDHPAGEEGQGFPFHFNCLIDAMWL